MRGLHFLAGVLQLGAGLLQLPLDLGEAVASRRCLFRLARGLDIERWGDFRKNDHDHPPQRLRFGEFLHRDIRIQRTGVAADFQTPQDERTFLLQRLVERAGQLVAQALACHGEDIPVRLAGGGFQVFSGAAADVEDVALLVGKHGWRAVAVQDQLLRQRLETLIGLRRGQFPLPDS